MKRTLLVLALVLSVTAINAQPKTAADAKKAVEKAIAATNDAKKAAKPATWIALADAYINAYEQPTKDIPNGADRASLKILMKDQKVISTSTKNGAEGSVFSVDSYADKDLYFNQNGLLESIIVTKPAIEGDILGEAIKALEEATKVDPKGSKKKDISDRYEKIHNDLATDAVFRYTATDYANAYKLFAQANEAYEKVGKIDTTNIYYAGMVAAMAGATDDAIANYKKCIEYSFYQEGNTFSNLANIYLQAGDTATCKSVLEDGFQKYPKSQGVLIGLINLYRETKDDVNKVFDLIHAAQANEPQNASLYYVEGDIYKQMGEIEKAAALYEKSSEVNPGYIFGKLGAGMLYYDHAVDIQGLADNEMDDAKYNALIKDLEENLAKAIAPFEAAFAQAENEPEIKAAVAEYLKNIYFRLRNNDESYAEKSKFYKDFLEANAQ